MTSEDCECTGINDNELRKGYDETVKLSGQRKAEYDACIE